jgi:hypothetical protein
MPFNGNMSSQDCWPAQDILTGIQLGIHIIEFINCSAATKIYACKCDEHDKARQIGKHFVKSLFERAKRKKERKDVRFLSVCAVVDLLGIRGAVAIGHSLGAFSIASAAALDAQRQQKRPADASLEPLFLGT